MSQLQNIPQEKHRPPLQELTIWIDIVHVGFLILIFLNNIENVYEFTDILINIPSFLNPYAWYIKIVIPTLIFLAILSGYFYASKTFFYRIRSGFWNGKGSRIGVNLLLVVTFSLLFLITENRLTDAFLNDKDLKKELNIKEGLATYTIQIEEQYSYIIDLKKTIKSNNEKINDIDTRRKNTKKGVLKGAIVNLLKSLKLENKELRNTISETNQIIKDIDANKTKERTFLLAQNKKNEKENTKIIKSAERKSQTIAGVFEIAIFFLSALSYVFKGEERDIWRSGEYDVVFDETEKIQKYYANKQLTYSRITTPNHGFLGKLKKKALHLINKDEQKETIILNPNHQKQDSSKDKIEVPQQTIDEKNEIKSKPTNGYKSKKTSRVLQTWKTENLNYVPKEINISSGEFLIKSITELSREETDILQKIETKLGGLFEAFITQLKLQIFITQKGGAGREFSKIYHEYVILYNQDKISMSYNAILTRFDLNHQSYKDLLLKLFEHQNAIYHYSQLVLIQKDISQEPRVMYENLSQN